MPSNVKSLEEMENMFSNTLPIEQLIFLELRDCDNAAGTPLYYEKVETLIRTINSHHKATIDKNYIKDMENAIEEILDPQAILHNARCSSDEKILVKKIKKTNYKKQHTAGLNFLSRCNITFKQERTAVL